ncbi:MAG: hypothetical protein JSS55_05635 [Proteobacteria bacterium]|nr:hypothetical protein [Pseudomonadota bacterium]
MPLLISDEAASRRRDARRAADSTMMPGNMTKTLRIDEAACRTDEIHDAYS